MRDLVALPKAHLHVHLESTIRPETLREIAAANGVAVPERSAEFAGFRQFGDHNALVRDCLRRPADFARIAREFCADEAAQGSRYVEVTFTAAAHGERLGDLGMPLAAVLDGLAEGQAENDIECRVLLDHSRRRPVARFQRTVHLAAAAAGRGVLGVGLAGEETYPLAPFAATIADAREAGLRIVHHAGESCGAASIREAIVAGQAERIGHGIRVLEDAELVAEVRERGLALEVCPSSNVALGVVPSWAAHPLPHLLAAGLAVTLHTDIPAIVGTSLAEEYRRVRQVFGLSDTRLAGLARAGVDASFAPAATKSRLREGIARWLAAPDPGPARS